MSMNPLVLLGLAAGGIALASAGKGKPVSQTLHPKAGETWTLTVRAVGAKLSPLDEKQFRAMATTYSDVQSYVLNDSGDTIVAVLTFKQDGHITTNQLIALTTSPGKGVIITDAVLVPGFPGAQKTVHVNAGETWQITFRAVGSKIVPADEVKFRSVAATYADIHSYVVNDSGDTLVVVLTYKAAATFTTNQLIALTTSPQRGIMITNAVLAPPPPPAPGAPPSLPT